MGFLGLSSSQHPFAYYNSSDYKAIIIAKSKIICNDFIVFKYKSKKISY